MLLTKIKWMAIGVAVTASGVFLFNHRDAFTSSSTNNSDYKKINPEFASYINAFTTGYVSSGTTIKVKLSNEFGNTTLNTPLKEDYFSFEPSIEGETVWKDAQTLEFKPKERLKPEQLYKATFHLNKLVEVKKELQEFEFQFETVKQSVQMQINDLKTYNSNDFNYYNVTGNVTTADFVDNEAIEKMLISKLGNTVLKPKWQHNDKGTDHKFLIDSIERPNTGYANLAFNCDAKALNIDVKLEKSFEVPKKGEFKLMETKLVNDNEQYVLLNYSNPIEQNQTLEGLVDLGGFRDLKFIINNNQVLIYPNENKTGSYVLKLEPGIKDTKGQRIEKASEHTIVFTEVKPSVRFLGEGNILPSSNNLSIPFECVNLRAVDVKIVKIYENNILQFLQNNSLDGGNNLAQVGKKIVEKRINLGVTNPADYSVWKKFSLDMSSLIKSEPGAIYRVFLSFKKSYSTYPCLGNGDDEKFEMEEIKEPADEEDISFNGYYYEDYYYSNYEYDENEDYNWSDRDNPCKSAYYRQYERTVAKNILASDLGLTLKKGNDGSLFVVANDLITTNPMADVIIEAYDYQKQLIQSDKTNSDGQLFMNTKQKVYFVVARKENQRAYLRLDDGATLPLSLYDVSGEAIKKGIKGFIYGERGVWRPGDSLFLNFILEDKLGNIPLNHPVVFELTNPQGQTTKRLFSNKSVDGFYNFSTVTDKNAPTGLWNAEVKIGSIKFNKSIRIETIMPNRLKIQVDAGDNKLWVASDKTVLKVHSNWLTGAVVHNLPLNVQVSLSSDNTSFPKFKDYTFDDATLHYEAQNITVLDDKLDDNGDISVPLNIDVQGNAPGFLKASFTTRVYEQGGAFSVDRFSMPYSPYTYYTGVKLPDGEKNTGILYTGKDHYIQIATCDFKGIATSRGNLKFEMYKLEWRWWWDQYADEVANYANDEYHKSVQSEVISSKNGYAKVRVNIKESEWGRYLIKVTDEDGHSASIVTYFDWPNWMERDGGSDNKIMSNMLNFTTDKNSYKTKDEVTVTIPSPEKCRALVTIENGSRVIEANWIETEKGTTKYKFKVKPEMAPNVYVHVSLIQPHAKANDLPIRLYGVVPITIDDPETHLKPVIEMPNELVPEQEVTIKVSEQNDKEMAFTLAVVDEGLLDITRFKTPNPWTTFYSKEALGVKTWDVYDNVIGAYGAELERILSIGGDGSEVGDDGAKANRFKPMVRFFGPFHVDKGDKQTIKFKMPMYVGSVRTMVIAGEKGAYGMAEKTTAVKAPLMVLGTLPRVLSVTEEVKLPISVFGGSKAVGSTQIKIEANDFLQVVGGAAKTINVGKDDEKLVSFDLKVKNKTGIAKVKITATGGGHTANYEIELDVRNPNPYQTTIKDFWVDGGKSISENINPVGLAGTNNGVLELSTIPPINLEERLEYLITYPHGCIEQTTSQTFAQLYLTDIMDLSPERKTAIEDNIKYGINEIRKFQLQNGAMAYWQGLTDPNDWGTSYAGHFLMLAEKKGYTLPGGMKKDWVSYQQTVAQNFEISKNKYYTNDMSQAYRLYTLALAKQPALSAMNRLREYGNLTNEARWLLASAYAQIGQIDEAEKLIAKASTDVANYKVNYYTYGSSDRDLAIILDALCNMNKKQQAFIQLKKVSSVLSSKSWLSTQTTAFGLVSVANFIKKFGGSSAMQANVTLNGKEITLKGNTAISQIPIDFKSGKGGNFKITNNGKGMLYVRLVNRGKPPIGDELESNANITVSTIYKDMNGNVINVDELGQSSNFMLSVTVSNLGLVGDVKNLALMNYIPSGWEIHNARMDDNEAALKNSDYTYQDIKDDKVLTYFDLNQNQSKTFNIMLNASYEGKYYLPAVNVEAMYDNSIFARTKGQWIKVAKQINDKVAGK